MTLFRNSVESNRWTDKRKEQNLIKDILDLGLSNLLVPYREFISSWSRVNKHIWIHFGLALIYFDLQVPARVKAKQAEKHLFHLRILPNRLIWTQASTCVILSFHSSLVSTLRNQISFQQCSKINGISHNLSLTCEKIL